MTATNHALCGILIGALLPLPVAVPLAFVSHFALDALPHYGIQLQKRNHSRLYKLIVFGDTFIALSLAVMGVVLHKWRLEITGWIAYSPDIVWVYYYFKHQKNLHIKIQNKFMSFHRRIQRYERPWGIYIELALAAVLLPICLMEIIK